MVWQYRYFNRGRCFGQYIFYASGRLWACQAAVPGKESHFYLPDAFYDDSRPAGLLPQYIMMAKMGLVNTLLAIILPYLSQSMFIFMSRQFFMGFQRNWRSRAHRRAWPVRNLFPDYPANLRSAAGNHRYF